MDGLTYLEADSAKDHEILEALDRDGAIVIENAIGSEPVTAILEELEPFIEGTAPFEEEFVGRKTTRTGGLVARSPSVREVVTHPIVMRSADAFLKRHAKDYQLNLTQIMRLLPGQTAQALHRDRYLWSRGLPREIEPMLNVMWAMTDFTERNGATRVIPGSHRWDWDRELVQEDSVAALMPRGSMLIYTGSVVHGGGENASNAPRIGMNITYLLSWLRQEENQYLSCPPEIARELSPELQALLGYSIGNGSLGYFSPTSPSKGQIDTLPPEVALGRVPDSQDEQQPF